MSALILTIPVIFLNSIYLITTVNRAINPKLKLHPFSFTISLNDAISSNKSYSQVAKWKLNTSFNPLNILIILNTFVDNLLNLGRAKKYSLGKSRTSTGRQLYGNTIQNIDVLFKNLFLRSKSLC